MTAYIVSSGQTLSDKTLTSNDTLEIQGGGVALSMTIDAGGRVAIDSGGELLSSFIYSDDTVAMAPHGILSLCYVESGATVSAGEGALIDAARIYGLLSGDETLGKVTFVEAGGVLAGGVESAGTSLVRVFAGGYVSGLSVRGDASLIIEGGVAENVMETAGAFIESQGGGELLFSGPGIHRLVVSTQVSVVEDGPGALVEVSASGTISGGMIKISEGAADQANILFASPSSRATLQIISADSNLPAINHLTNIDYSYERVDLQGFSCVSGATAVRDGNVLTVHDGSTEFEIDLSGTAANKFVVSGDSFGGTVIHPAVGARIVSLIQAAATVRPSMDIGLSESGPTTLNRQSSGITVPSEPLTGCRRTNWTA